MMKNVLVTGVTSFLGRHLAERLADGGADVHGVVRSKSDLVRLGRVADRLTLHTHDGGTVGLADIMAKASPGTVFHLAGHYLRDHKPEEVESLIRDNFGFGTQVLEAMRIVGCGRIVNTGTFTQFFDGEGSRALNLYAALKQGYEDILEYYMDAYEMAGVTLVLYDVYGPGDWRAKLVPTVQKAQAEGHPLPVPSEDVQMDLVYVDDVADAFIAAAELLETSPEQVSGKRFAVRFQQTHGIRDVVALFEEEGGRPIECKEGQWPKPPRVINKPWEGPLLPGWEAKTPLREGVRLCLGEGLGGDQGETAEGD